MTRLALMVNCLSTGGAETQLVRLAVELKRMGHDVGVMSLLAPNGFTEVLADAGVPVASVGPTPRYGHGDRVAKAGVVRGILPAVRTLRAWRTQALICFIHEASLYGRFVGRLAGVPVVIGSERNIWREGPVDAVVSRWTDRLLSTTVVNAPAVRTDLVTRRIVRRDAVEVIPNGIDVNAYRVSRAARTALRREVGVTDEFVWLAVGRLTPQKDFSNLLRAYAAVVADRPVVRLLIAGSGVLREQLGAHARELGIDHHVTFLGERDDVPRLLSGADALVMSSESEGLPNVVMEAFAAALPVVATDVGGVSELVVPGRTGTLVPPGDSVALATAMRELMSAPAEHRADLGRNGHELVRSRHGMPQVAQRWVEVVDELLAGRRDRPHRAMSGRTSHGRVPDHRTSEPEALNVVGTGDRRGRS